MAKSLIDYVFRYLGARFLPGDQRGAIGLPERDETTAPRPLPAPRAQLVDAAPASVPTTTVHTPIGFAAGGTTQAPITFSPQADAPSCPDCGSLMVRNGACYKCFNCGATSGCS
jgi:ribonucleoside-diphosphate reductase alpha chain